MVSIHYIDVTCMSVMAPQLKDAFFKSNSSILLRLVEFTHIY